MIEVDTEADVRTKLGEANSILLSASVPTPRDFPPHLKGAALQSLRQNLSYLKTSKPAEIRSAVTALTRLMLQRRIRLVFGAHPAISPMVLSAARDVLFNLASRDPGNLAPPSPYILIFQSKYFGDVLPDSTLDLASWYAGLLVMTPLVSGGRQPRDDEEARLLNLRRMRELMVSVPGLRGAVFVGGMEGVVEEAHLFAKRNPGKPMYALGSTGSAALELSRKTSLRQSFTDTQPPPSSIHNSPSYSVVAHDILEDLKI
jgi:hypothetical protein